MTRQSGRKNGFAERRGEALHWGKIGKKRRVTEALLRHWGTS